MNQLAVFGASGQTGGLIVELALARGQAARVLVRPSAAFDARPGVTVLRGSVEEAKDVLETLSGTDAVCCVFGPRATTAAPFCARATAQVISGMKSAGIRRLVCLTGAMVGDLPRNVSIPMRLLATLYRNQVPRLAADAAEQERLVMESGMDWTLAKPPRLTDGPATGRVRSGPALRVGLLSRISRRDLASFLVGEIADPHHVRERVYVSG